MTQIVASQKEDNCQRNINFVQKLKSFLDSNWSMLLISLIVSIFWVLDIPMISITFLTIFVCLVFSICRENPKAFLLPFLLLLYCFNSLPNVAQLIYCVVCGLVAVGFLIYCIVWQIKVKKVKCTKGKMFWPFLILTIVNLLGGVIGHFNIFLTLIILCCFLLIYFLYWFYLNFTNNCQKYFAWCAIFFALTITIEIYSSYAMTGNFIEAIINKAGRVGVGAPYSGSINCASIIMLLGVCSGFYLAAEEKKDYLYLLIVIAIDISIFFAYSRIATFMAALISLIGLIYVIVKSQNKKIYIIVSSVLLGIILLFGIIFWEKTLELFTYYLNIGFSLNGRDVLWEWCWEEFKKNLAFGIGFFTKDFAAVEGGIPGIPSYGSIATVYCHNFFLHHFVCIGIVGTIFIIPFYIRKYQILLKKVTSYNLLVLFLSLSLFLTSLFDPTYTSNLFLIVFVLILISSSEKISFDNESDEKDVFIKNQKLTLSSCEENIIISSNIDNKSVKEPNKQKPKENVNKENITSTKKQKDKENKRPNSKDTNLVKNNQKSKKTKI